MVRGSVTMSGCLHGEDMASLPSLSCPVPMGIISHHGPFKQDAATLWYTSFSMLQKLSSVRGYAESSEEPEVGLKYRQPGQERDGLEAKALTYSRSGMFRSCSVQDPCPCHRKELALPSGFSWSSVPAKPS